MSMEEIQRVVGFPDDQLVYNHRLPKKIARVAEYYNVNHDDLEGRCRYEGEEKPFILRYLSLEDQLLTIAYIIRTKRLDDVGILVPRNEQVKAVWEFLKSQGVNAEVKYSVNERVTSTLNFATSNPKIMTYHSSKGLQFGTVFLPECDDPRLDQFAIPLYVAMTRAYQSLYIMYSGQLPQVLQRVPRDLYENQLRAREVEVL